MIKTIIKFLKKIIPQKIKMLYNQQKKKNNKKSNNRKIFKEWIARGKPVPPPHIVKQRLINSYKRKFRYTTFIETGTYLGEMVEAQIMNFKRIYSVELSRQLYTEAKEKFSRYSHITILNGDSSKVLYQIFDQVKDSCIFWLDGHYSAGMTAKGDKICPIIEELDAIFATNKKHILLIDDANCFTGEGDYPTIMKLSKYILDAKPGSKIDIKDNIISVIIE